MDDNEKPAESEDGAGTAAPRIPVSEPVLKIDESRNNIERRIDDSDRRPSKDDSGD